MATLAGLAGSANADDRLLARRRRVRAKLNRDSDVTEGASSHSSSLTWRSAGVAMPTDAMRGTVDLRVGSLS